MTINEIYNTMSEAQRASLKTRIMMDGVAYTTAYAYCRGTRRPKLLYRQRIAGHIKAILGINYTVDELFPEAKA